MSNANQTQIGGDHYQKKAIQPWDYIIANDLPFMEGSIVKYITRWRDKAGIKDLEKARHFIEKLIEVETAKLPKEKYPDIEIDVILPEPKATTIADEVDKISKDVVYAFKGAAQIGKDVFEEFAEAIKGIGVDEPDITEEPIPECISYSVDYDHFYITGGHPVTNNFYEKWYDRRNEFPQI